MKEEVYTTIVRSSSRASIAVIVNTDGVTRMCAPFHFERDFSPGTVTRTAHACGKGARSTCMRRIRLYTEETSNRKCT